MLSRTTPPRRGSFPVLYFPPFPSPSHLGAENKKAQGTLQPAMFLVGQITFHYWSTTVYDQMFSMYRVYNMYLERYIYIIYVIYMYIYMCIYIYIYIFIHIYIYIYIYHCITDQQCMIICAVCTVCWSIFVSVFLSHFIFLSFSSSKFNHLLVDHLYSFWSPFIALMTTFRLYSHFF